MAKSVSQKAVFGEVTTFALGGLGVVLGNVIGNMAEKAVNKEGAAGTLPKRLIVPLGLAAVGAVGSLKVKNKNAKLVLGGIGAAGLLRGAKAVMPNNTYLQGVGTTEDEMGSVNTYEQQDWIPATGSGVQGINTYSGNFPQIGGYGEGVNRNIYAQGDQMMNSGASANIGIGSLEDAQVIL